MPQYRIIEGEAYNNFYDCPAATFTLQKRMTFKLLNIPYWKTVYIYEGKDKEIALMELNKLNN